MSVRPGIVGAFILGATGVGVAGILFFGGTRMFSETRHAVAYFSESVAGLEVGAAVTFHGVRIGQVKNVALEFSAETMSVRIPVVLEFQPEQITWEGGKRLAEDAKDFERLVRAGLRAQLQMQSFVTGQVRVDLDFQPETPMRLTGASTNLPEIPTVPSELGQLFSQLSKLRLQDLAEIGDGGFRVPGSLPQARQLAARSPGRQRQRRPGRGPPDISHRRRRDRSLEGGGFDRAARSRCPSRRRASSGRPAQRRAQPHPHFGRARSPPGGDSSRTR